MKPYRLTNTMRFGLLFLAGVFLPAMVPSSGWAANTADTVRKTVDQSIAVHRNTQKEMEKWEKERVKLAAEYDALKQRLDLLETENAALMQDADAQRSRLERLQAEQTAGLKIQEEMLPFLENVYQGLEHRIQSDPPFLFEERRDRLKKLSDTLAAMDISIAEKYRKTMEALFIEAEYGNTIEVTRDRIDLAGENILADQFRLGRISLFALTLDQQQAAVFDVARNRWAPLDSAYLAAVSAAVDIARKQRTVEMLSLPIGQLSPEQPRP